MKKRRELQIVKELSPEHDIVKTLRDAGFSVKRVVGLAKRPVISEQAIPSSVEGRTMNQLIAQVFGKARQSRLEEAPRAESAAQAGREEKAIAAAEENPGSKEQQRFASSLQLALRASRTKGRAAAAEAMEPVSPAVAAAQPLQEPPFFTGAGPTERYKRPQLILPGVGFHGVGKHDAGVRRRMLLELKEVHSESEDNRDRVG